MGEPIFIYSTSTGTSPIMHRTERAQQLIDLSRAGLTGVALSLVNYIAELPYFCDEVMPRLERAGIRAPH